MNKVILSGGLTRDPEIRYTQSGKAVATMSLGVNRGYKKAENSQYPQSDYFNIVAWDKSAEFCSKYLTKGSRIIVEGRLQSRSYEAQDGSKRNVVEVVANEIEFAGGKRQEGGDGGNYNNYSGGYSNDNNSRPSTPSFGNGDDMIDNSNKNTDDIDIPF